MLEFFKNGPTISYGKRKNLDPGIVEDYLILPDSTKGFTSDEKNNFEKICKSFSWTSTSNPGEILPPCYGFFLFGDGSSILVARFIDDGRDNQGRADLLRVDAIKIPIKLIYGLKVDFRLFFESSSWESVFSVENSAAKNAEISQEVIDAIFDLLQTNHHQSLIIGCSRNFKFKPAAGKFNTFDINSKTVEEIKIPEILINSPPPTTQNPGPRDVVQKNLLLVILLFLGNIVFGWLAYDLNFNQIEKLKNGQTIAEAELKIIISDKNQVIDNKNDEIQKKEGIIKEKDKAILEKTKFPTEEIMNKLKIDFSLKHAREVLQEYESEARKDFFEKVNKTFLESQKEALEKWVTQQKPKENKPKPK